MLLDHEPGMVVVGLSDRLPGLLAQLGGSQPDVLLLDWELSDQPMTDLLTDVHNLERRPKTIVLPTRPQEKETIMASGAYYLIWKDAPPDKLLSVLNEIRLSQAKNNHQ
jgi:DNA-binding NarL/FixJ family response regulator